MTFHKKLTRLDLTLKVSILIIVIVLSTSTVLNLVFRDFFKNYSMDAVYQHIVFFSRTEGRHYGHHILDGNIKIIHKHILDNILAHKNINNIHVYDRDGCLIVDRSGLKRERPTDKWIQDCLKSMTTVNRFEGYLFRHFEPMTVEGKVAGFLYIEFNADFLLTVLAKGRNFFIYMTGILILIFVSIGVVISKRLISPLIDITEASKRVAEGDLSVSVPVKARDERGILSENFNLMVNRLKEAQAEITNYARNLEHVVELRTERLNSALKELREGKEFIERIFSTVGALIVVLNAEGRIVMFNRECEDVTGFGEDEAKGKYVWDFLLPERFIAPVMAVFADLTNQKLPNSLEKVMSSLFCKISQSLYSQWFSFVLV
ncbi:MAG: HAMP domain-containing protein [Nitrospirota bacterium]